MKIVSVTLRFPAKKTQYGYAEAVVEFDGDWTQLGTEYREAVQAFQAGENSDKVKPAPKVKVDPSEMISDADLYAALSDDAPEDVQRAASEYMMRELGATDITDIMNEDVDEETPEWEKSPPPPSDDDWDF